MTKRHTAILLLVLGLCLGGTSLPSPGHPAESALNILKKHIVFFNQKALEESLKDGSHMGEAGILRIKPEAAKALGMKVFMDPDYADAKVLLKKANMALDKAKTLMYTRIKEKIPDEHAKMMVEYILAYKESKDKAKGKLRAYYSRLTPQNDDRLDRAACEKALDKLLAESLKAEQNRVRDALGRTFNVCQEVSPNSYPLTPENIPFVNGVFRAFVREAKKTDLTDFHLDRVSDYGPGASSGHWKKILGAVSPQYIPPLESALAKYGTGPYPVDPLLFMALMKRESLFDPLAVSYVGAAGLTQIMPGTGKDLGMKAVFMPDYFDDAVTLLMEERRTKQRAFQVLLQIQDEEKGLEQARKARALMRKGVELGRKRERLFDRYKRELLKQTGDERLKPEKAIPYGYRYLVELMKQQKGDISLALASYNAGPHRVSEYQGIPPYEETVLFRNKVLEFYREYLKKDAEKGPAP